MNEVDPLDPGELAAEGQDLLSALKNTESPTKTQLDAGLGRLQASVGGPSGATSSTVLKVVAGLTVAGTAVWLATTFLPSGGGHAGDEGEGRWQGRSDSTQPSMPDDAPAMADPTPRREEPEAEPAAEAVPAAEVEPAAVDGRTIKRGKREVPPPSKPHASDLEAELALLRAATAALKAEDTEQALREVDEHERRFRHGNLAVERELLRARAQCEAGNGDAARATARRVLKSRPGTHLADRLRQVCASK